MTIRGRLLLSAGLALVGALSVAASANALTLGQVAPPDLGGCVSCEGFQLKVGAGAPKYRVPAGSTGLWTINSWSAQGGGSANGRARLRVYRRTQTGGQFKLVKQSDLKTVPKDGSPSFATSLNVRQGDFLGLGVNGGLSLGYGTTFIDSDLKILGCDPTGVGQLVGAGTTCPLFDDPSDLINVSATLTPR